MRVSEFVQSYFDAWNHGDAKAVADHLAADGIYCDVPENTRRNHDELIISLNGFFAEFRHRYELIGEILSGDNTVAFQYRVLPTGHGQRLRGAEFMTMHDGAALTIMDYYDTPQTARPSQIATLAARNGRKSVKYAKSGLSPELMQRYKQRLEHIMQVDQAYLRSDLTLPRLAKAIDCSVNHLSQVINSGFGMSFFDYLNHYRIQHAKQLLSQASEHNGAVLNIAFSVGFNSNSAFYSAFKKCVGQTPAQYRRRQLSK